MRPHVFATGEKMAGLRSLGEVRQAIRSGHTANLWQGLVEKVNRESEEPCWTPRSPLPERDEKHVKNASREFELVGMTCSRIIDGAFAALVLNDRRYVEPVLGQIETLFDQSQWPEIDDEAHLRGGAHCVLRRGQFATAIGLAYDWMYGLLTDEERTRLIKGFDSRFTRQFRAAVEIPDAWVKNRNNNFITVIFGGFGIAGMAFGEDYSESAWLTETCTDRMENYVEGVFGPEGEFNESVPYAGSTHGIVAYLNALRYASAGDDNPFQRHDRLAAFCRWYMHMTLPPGRVAALGDNKVEAPPIVAHFAAVAAALQDPVLQWFYLQYADTTWSTHRKRALELLYYDDTLDAQAPDGHMPLGKAYHNQGRLFSSRSSWDPLSCTSVVYGKVGREDSHGHADWGQVCIDGYGERLIVDLGATQGYPPGKKQYYYNYQQLGHNVPVFGGNDTGGVSLNTSSPTPDRKYPQGCFIFNEFDDHKGGALTMDITEPYGKTASRVLRTIVHTTPEIITVIDDISLTASQLIRLRWHTIAPAPPDEHGRFFVQGSRPSLACMVTRIDGPAGLSLGRHEYQAPYNRDRIGALYPQLREPYTEIRITDDTCRIVSLFAVFGPDEQANRWEHEDTGWRIETAAGHVAVSCVGKQLRISRDQKPVWQVDL